LSSVDDKSGSSAKHDRISTHIIFNMMIPAPAQLQILPRVGYTDGFFSLTERQLIDCLFQNFITNNGRLQPRKKKLRQLSSTEQARQHSLAHILYKFFGPRQQALDNTQDEIGRLSFFLFLNGKNTSYRRGSNVLWAKDDRSLSSSSSSSSSSSTHPPGALQQQSLRARVLFESDDVRAMQEARTALDNMAANDSRYVTDKQAFKDLVRRSLQSPNHYQDQIDNATPKVKRQKYVLTGDLSTNGYDLRVMAYKLTEKKAPRQPATSTTSNIQATTILSNSPIPLLSTPDFHDSTGGESPSASSLMPASSSASTSTSTSSPTLPWSTAPTISGWSYIAEKFNSQERVDKLYQNTTGPQNGTRSLCIDPGVASTGTATLVHSEYPKDAINLDIPRGPRDVIDRRYRKEQNALKVEDGILDVEARLVPLKRVEIKVIFQQDQEQAMGDVSGDMGGGEFKHDAGTETLAQAMDKAVRDHKSNVESYIISQARESSALRAYYGRDTFKRDKYNYREAIRHDLDKATTAVLDMRKCVPDRQPTDEDLQTIIHSVQSNIEEAKRFTEGLSSFNHYDWTSYLERMNKASMLSEVERGPAVLKTSVKMARSLFKRGYLGLSRLSDDMSEAFLASPLIIGIGDGDFRKWGGQSRGVGKFVNNLIRQASITDFGDRSKRLLSRV
jgi:hypothetical protein